MGLPIHDAARRAIAHAGHVLAEDIQHAEHDLSKLIRHGRYHQQQAPATPATEAPMTSALSTLEADFGKVRDEVENFAKNKLPEVASIATKLDGNPVVEALLRAAHVPTEALDMAVKVIDGLEELYKPTTDAPAPSEPTAAEPAPAAAAPVNA